MCVFAHQFVKSAKTSCQGHKMSHCWVTGANYWHPACQAGEPVDCFVALLCRCVSEVWVITEPWFTRRMWGTAVWAWASNVSHNKRGRCWKKHSVIKPQLIPPVVPVTVTDSCKHTCSTNTNNDLIPVLAQTFSNHRPERTSEKQEDGRLETASYEPVMKRESDHLLQE